MANTNTVTLSASCPKPLADLFKQAAAADEETPGTRLRRVIATDVLEHLRQEHGGLYMGGHALSDDDLIRILLAGIIPTPKD
jgi:hypothetical protein